MADWEPSMTWNCPGQANDVLAAVLMGTPQFAPDAQWDCGKPEYSAAQYWKRGEQETK